MTKVPPCYSLCPLVEQNSFLGIASDAEADTVIVTTSSNIIGRYRVSDPKEIGSWNSKGSISCSTVFDACDCQYVTIFKGNEIRKWLVTDKRIDKVKKYKFAEKLHGLATTPETGQALVIFGNGAVLRLNDAIEVRKNSTSTSWISDDERISSFEVVSVSAQLIVVLLVQRPNGSSRIVGVSVDSRSLLFDLQVEHSNRSLCGHCIVFDKGCHFVSLWSDGKLYRDCIFPRAGCVPANNVATLDDLHLEQPVAMKALSPYDVALCAARDDGLQLLVFSLKYNSTQSKRFYENCPNQPQLWSVNSTLFAIMGHNLVVIPYVQENRKLSTLVGSNHPVEDNVSLLPESKICGDTLPSLLEHNQEARIREMLTSGYDVPDSVLLDILKWSLTDVSSRGDILDLVLGEYCSSLNDVSQLRAACSVDQSLFVLEHIMSKLAGSANSFKLLKWASLFVDAFYQQYVMSDDTAILNKFNEYISTLNKEEGYVNEFMQLSSVLSCVQRKKVILTT